jgi:hypothetical protein
MKPLAGALVLAALFPAVAAAQRADFRWAGRLAPGKTVEVKGIQGAISAVAASGTEVEVLAMKHGDADDTADVEIRVVEHEGGVTICAVYPGGDWGRHGRSRRHNDCRPGDEDDQSVDNNDVEVEFSVRLPAGVKLVARSVDGDIEATHLASDVDAETVDGSITISTTGAVQAQTVDGDIRVVLEKGGWTSPLEFRTTDGDITVDFPAAGSAVVRAQTVDGEIKSDFPLTLEERMTRKRLTGTIGRGGPELRLTTVDGTIRLRKA